MRSIDKQCSHGRDVAPSRGTRLATAGCVVACMLSSQGCATTATIGSAVDSDSTLIMSGTRLNLALLDHDSRSLSAIRHRSAPVYPLADLPFSLALDTVLLAFTVPTALVLTVAKKLHL